MADSTTPATTPTPGDGVTTLPATTPPSLPPDIKQGVQLLTLMVLQNGVVAQQNFITTNKMIDADYLENKRRVSPQEAVAVDELEGKPIGSKPAGA